MSSYVNGLADSVRDEDDVDAVFWCPAGDPGGGYLVIAKPAGWFDAHPDGECNPDVFVRVRCKAGWLRQQGFVGDIEVPKERIVYRFVGRDEKEYEIPEDHVVFRSGKLYGVIETSDFKGGLEEGLGVISDGRMPEYVVGEQLIEMPADIQPVVLLESESKQTVLKRIRPPSAKGRNNLVYQNDVSLADTTEEEYMRLVDKYDTRENAILTVGTGKTYATISAAITASSSGDIIEVYATTGNIYTETITTATKALQIVGMVANRVITITNNVATVVTLQNTTGAILFKNFTVVGTASTSVACVGMSFASGAVVDVTATGAVHATGKGFAGSTTNAGVFVINCLAYDNTNGFTSFGAGVALLFVHCTAVDNTENGFWQGLAGGYPCRAYLCLGAGNGEDFDTTQTVWVASACMNASADSTAPGVGSATGFLTTDFEDYAGNDFRLKASVKETTKARFYGYPLHPYDAFGNQRNIDGIVFAGAHDPDPVENPDPEENDVRYGVQYGNPSKTGTYRLGAHDRSFSTPPVKIQSTDTTIASGNASTRRRVWVRFHNAGSASRTIALKHIVSSVEYEVYSDTLAAGDDSPTIAVSLEANDTLKAVSDADDDVIASIVGVEDILS